MKKIYCQIGMLGVLLAFALPAFSIEKSNVACPVESPYGMSYDDRFGPGTEERLRCNQKRTNVRMVMQVNAYEQGGKPYGFRNLNNIITDLKTTHGISDWKIAIVVHSGGGDFVLNGNKYESLVSGFIANPNVDVYFCLNTAAAKGWTTDMIIPGVKFVPAGLSAIMDFQYQGYKYIQP